MRAGIVVMASYRLACLSLTFVDVFVIIIIIIISCANTLQGQQPPAGRCRPRKKLAQGATLRAQRGRKHLF